MSEIEKTLKKAKEDNIRFVNLQFSDVQGTAKNITILVEQLEEALKEGVWFDGSSIEGFTRIHESDMYLKPDPCTYAVIPWFESEERSCRFICDVHKPDGSPFPGDPRFILKEQIKRANTMGFEFYTGPELEFFIFKKENGHIEVLPHDKGGYFDLTVDNAYEIRREMIQALTEFGILVEAAHHEVAIGQHEIDFKYDKALRTADNAFTFKFVLKAIAQINNLHVTFMPKPIFGKNGSGMHVHQSLFDVRSGKNLFYNANDKYNLSDLAKQFIAGQLKHIKGMSAVLSPTVNSYKRLTPGYEAPTYICWASTNRSALIRIPRIMPGKQSAARAEIRCPDPSANPYMAFAVLLCAGLDGIEKGMQAPEPIEENVYDLKEKELSYKKIEKLPFNLYEALAALDADSILRDALGEHLYGAFKTAKLQEWKEFRTAVTDWELNRYLEIL